MPMRGKLVNQSKQTRFFSIMVLAVAFIIFSIVFLIPYNSKPKPNSHPNVKISFHSQTPILESIETNSEIGKNESDNIAQPASTPTIGNNSIAFASNSVQIKMQDLLGISIPNGTIVHNGTSIPFSGGTVVVSDLEPQRNTFIAEADGYQSASQSIDVLQEYELVFNLDYLCSFDFQVFEDSARTLRSAGAVVEIFQGLTAPRPIQKRHTAFISTFMGNPSTYQFEYDDSQCSIINANRKKDIFKKQFDSSLGFGIIDPEAGDVLFSIAFCPWLALPSCLSELNAERASKRKAVLPLTQYNSTQMRLMDALSLSAHAEGWLKGYELISLKREDDRGSALIYFPLPSKDAPVIARLNANEMGRCNIQGLTPGLYYAQAIKGNSRSSLFPLHPASGGLLLELSAKAQLFLKAELSGVPSDYQMESIALSGVSIVAKSIKADGTLEGVYMAETGAKGQASIPSMPFGKYRIMASPPPERGLSPIARDIEISQPDQLETFYFSGWKKLKIEGEVLEYQTRKPVPNYAVELLENRPGGFFNIGMTLSDENGKFTFSGLPAGEYNVTHYMEDFKDLKYSPYDLPKDNQPYIPLDYWIDNYRSSATLTDKDVTDVKIWVIPNNYARIIGIVVDKNNRPVANARLTVLTNDRLSKKMPTMELNPITDQDGRFDITVICKQLPQKNAMYNKAKVHALVARIIPPKLIPIVRKGKTYGKTLTDEKTIPLSEGSQEIELLDGETIKDVRITIDNLNLKTLEGIIKTENGFWLDHVEATINQQDYKIPLDIDAQGAFLGKEIMDAPFTLNISQAYRSDSSNPLGIVPYSDEVIYLQIPKDESMMHVDVTLKELGYIEGQVLDRNRSPIIDAKVIVRSQDGKTQFRMSNGQGRFIIWAPNSEIYSLLIEQNESNNAIEYINDIKPNVSNIIVQLKAAGGS